VIVEGNYSHEYYLPHTESATVTGVLPNVIWRPSYTSIVSDDSTIRKLILLAHVETNGPSFRVDQLMFNTKGAIADSDAPRAMTLQSDAARSIGVENVYYVDDTTTIQRQHFLQVSENAIVQYGYIFSLSSQVPPGRITIYDADFKVVGISQLEIYGNVALMKVASENKLLSTVIINRGENSTQMTVEIDSQLNQSV
jgi:hypothetical protein